MCLKLRKRVSRFAMQHYDYRSRFYRSTPMQCTAGELDSILRAPCGGMLMLPSQGYDLVWPHIYIGDEYTARNIEHLRALHVTHVLNCAQGSRSQMCVPTDGSFYQKARIQFKGLKAFDLMNFDLSQFFYEAADYIQRCLDEHGTIYVHCHAGVSRSATIVITYLMLRHRMTAQQALRTVRHKREISPNDGFLQQICDLNEALFRQGHFNPVPTHPGASQESRVLAGAVVPSPALSGGRR